MERRTIKLPDDDYERHNQRRKDMGLTWAEYIDGEAPEDVTKIDEFPSAVVFTNHDEKHEGRTELYENWVRVSGSIPAWIPREEIEQLHES